MTGRGRLAFVAPRYGADVVGGSEAVMREAAHGLAARGWSVDLLTTCARDHYTWRNEYPPGRTEVDGVAVYRFPVEPGRGGPDHARLAGRINTGEHLTETEQLEWLDGLFRVPGLFHHLVVGAAGYDAIVLSPYLWWTTVTGAAVAPERTVVMPCLHDEAYARVPLLQTTLSTPALLWFLSEPEHELAHELVRLPERHVVTGAGVQIPAAYDPDGFRRRHGLERPFALYAGRREGGKGWDWLLRAYALAVSRHDLPLDLVTFGVGTVAVPSGLEGRVVDLGFLDESEVGDAFAAATVYVQPSANESFSRTVMEAWLAGTLVLVTDQSAVLRWHCERSGAGIGFGDEYELAQALAFAAARPDVAATMAARGREYVLANYRWDIVLDAMERSLEDLR
ncbi:MAG: glycosyltransferase family 4 protein [Actinomycetota bacterium]